MLTVCNKNEFLIVYLKKKSYFTFQIDGEINNVVCYYLMYQDLWKTKFNSVSYCEEKLFKRFRQLITNLSQKKSHYFVTN